MYKLKDEVWRSIVEIKLLENVLEKNFSNIDINEYKETTASVIKIAEEAINQTDNLSYKNVNDTKILFYYKDTEVGGINGQTLLTNTKEGTRNARDKFRTEQYLTEKGVRTTKSHIFGAGQINDAKNEIKKYDEAFVLKPYNLSSGKGVSLNVDADNIEAAWAKSIGAYEGNLDGARIIMQPQLPGIEARFLVINGKFSSAILRAPANIVGDGQSTIEELIKQKNYLREKHPHLNKFIIQINDELKNHLKRSGLTLSSIPENSKVVFFTDVSNIALGGDTLEISHLASDELKCLAEYAVNAVPGLSSAGVDIMFTHFDDCNASVLEINHAANLVMHYYPWKGQSGQPIHDYLQYLNEEAVLKNSFKYRMRQVLKRLLGN